MSKIYFTFERIEPFKYPEPRDIRSQLQTRMNRQYNNKPLSSITLSTEFVLKTLKSKQGLEIPLLRYKVINLDWDITKDEDNIKFEKQLFKFAKGEEQEHGIIDNDI